MTFYNLISQKFDKKMIEKSIPSNIVSNFFFRYDTSGWSWLIIIYYFWVMMMVVATICLSLVC